MAQSLRPGRACDGTIASLIAPAMAPSRAYLAAAMPPTRPESADPSARIASEDSSLANDSW
jgi:hypothetical protein